MPVRRRAERLLPQDSLWQHRDFQLLWAAQTVSQFGSQITLLAIPLIAALTLDATPFAMGILAAAYMAPFLIFGLFAGVWIDRLQRKPILIASDILRALVLLTVPLAAALDLLRIELLYAVQFLVGALTLFFDVAYQSYLPALVRRDQLPEGNSKLEMSRATARITGPSIAGLLVRWFSGPVAIAVDALTYVLSTLFLMRIKSAEPEPKMNGQRRVMLAEIREGLAVVARDPILRATTAAVTLANLSDSVIMAIYVLFATRELDLGPGIIGIIFASGNIGGLFGAALAGRIAARRGPGTAIVAGFLFSAIGIPLIVLAGGPPLAATAVLIAAQVFASAGLFVSGINVVSVRQAITPERILGRVNATVRFASWGLLPFGSLLGGTLGSLIGLRPTFAVGAMLGIAAFLLIWLSPVRHVQSDQSAAPAPLSDTP